MLTCDQQRVKVYLRDEVCDVQTVAQNIMNLGGKQPAAGGRVEVEVEVNIVDKSLGGAKHCQLQRRSQGFPIVLPFKQEHLCSLVGVR